MLHNFCGQTENGHNFFQSQNFSKVSLLKPQDPFDLNQNVAQNLPTALLRISLKNSLLVMGM